MDADDRDAVATRAADVQQAAYFRESLVARREELSESLPKLRAAVKRHRDRADPFGVARSAGEARRRAEAEVHHIDRLIATLEHRFPQLAAEGRPASSDRNAPE